MNNTIALAYALLTVILNGLIGHFLVGGILLTPFIMTITSMLVCCGTKNINAIFISMLTFLFVSLNDISNKLYAGGISDSEGIGVINLLLLIGLVPTSGILLTAILKNKDERIINKIVAIGLFAGLTLIHIQLFSDLGLRQQ